MPLTLPEKCKVGAILTELQNCETDEDLDDAIDKTLIFLEELKEGLEKKVCNSFWKKTKEAGEAIRYEDRV